jgi:hypothetical protein
LSRPLEVLHSLTLDESIRPGEAVTAYFKLRNRGAETITLGRLGVACRGPQTALDSDNLSGLPQWKAPNVDFAFAENVRLAPGQEYEYRKTRSFSDEGQYYAMVSYGDAAGLVHTLTGPVEFAVTASAISQDDAALVGRAPVPVAVTGAKVAVSLQVQNTGSADWPVGQGYALQNVNGQPLGSLGRIELQADIPTGAVANWSLPLQAPNTPGLYRSEWQMVHGNQAFGPTIGIEMRVLGVNPSGWLERLRQEIERQLAEWRATLEREIEEALRKELERQVRSICGSALIAPGLMLLATLWLSDRAKGNHET